MKNDLGILLWFREHYYLYFKDETYCLYIMGDETQKFINLQELGNYFREQYSDEEYIGIMRSLPEETYVKFLQELNDQMFYYHLYSDYMTVLDWVDTDV